MQQLQMLNIQYTTSRIGNFQFLTRLQPKLRPSSNSTLLAESLPFVFDCLWLLTHWPRQQARFTLQWPLTAFCLFDLMVKVSDDGKRFSTKASLVDDNECD